MFDDAKEVDELMKRYSTMTNREILLRAIALEAYVSGLTGKLMPEVEYPD